LLEVDVLHDRTLTPQETSRLKRSGTDVSTASRILCCGDILPKPQEGEKTRKIQTIVVGLLIGLLAMPLASLAQAAPRRAVAKALWTEAKASTLGAPFSKYNITATTGDGGHMEFLFVWQRSIEWNARGPSGKLIMDTSPILHMAKYNANGSLETSITYTPLFLMQYNDSDTNGLFDLWTKDHQEVSDKVEDNEIEWERVSDRPYRVYPLAPMYHMMLRQHEWEWTVTPLVNTTTSVNETEVQEFSWSITATVPSMPWVRNDESEEQGFLHGRNVQWTTIDITLGYHVRLLPQNPEVKYDLRFTNTDWADARNLRLAMFSSILYRSSESVAVKLGNAGFKALNQTIRAKAPILMVSEKAVEDARAFVSYASNASVDGANVEDAVKTAVQPAFLLPKPMVVPEGLYVRGVITDMEGKPSRHYILFADQVSVPRFKYSLEVDPTIGIVAQLAIVSLPALPRDLTSLRLLAVVAAAAIVGTTVYLLASRRKGTAVTAQ